MISRLSANKGFTIVELLIVIVVIAVLASITVVAYNGIQVRSRDSVRKADVAAIIKALELYYTQNGEYPASSCASNCVINGSWSTTADGSWNNLSSLLVPDTIAKLPVDPANQTYATSPLSTSTSFHYSYFANTNTSWCTNKPARQLYKLTYRLEGAPQQDTMTGTCDTTSGNAITQSMYTSSEYTVIK